MQYSEKYFIKVWIYWDLWRLEIIRHCVVFPCSVLFLERYANKNPEKGNTYLQWEQGPWNIPRCCKFLILGQALTFPHEPEPCCSSFSPPDGPISKSCLLGDVHVPDPEGLLPPLHTHTASLSLNLGCRDEDHLGKLVLRLAVVKQTQILQSNCKLLQSLKISSKCAKWCNYCSWLSYVITRIMLYYPSN